MGLYEELNKAALTAIGLRPQWEALDLDACTGRPGVAGDGAYCEDSPATMVSVALRISLSHSACCG